MPSKRSKKTVASQELKRARWRRNKRAERERRRPLPPSELPVEVLSAIEEESSLRLRKGKPPDLQFNITDHGWGSHAFHCDVWSVRTRLRAQRPGARITAGTVARWMAENGLSYGYKASSLRTMVYRAFNAISAMEQPNLSPLFGRARGPWWGAFDPFQASEAEN